MSDENRGRYYPALVIESPTTPKQRARNFALYLRLRDGTPVEERSGTRDGVGLHVFGFEVPLKSCSMGADHNGPTMSFRLDKDGECYRRLLSYITDHFFNGCDADDEVARLIHERDNALRVACDAMQRLISKAKQFERYPGGDGARRELREALADLGVLDDDRRTALAHDLVKTGDADSAPAIEDSNGEVVLAYCRVCRKGEDELGAACSGAWTCGDCPKEGACPDPACSNGAKAVRS